jgi:hypothetical protein
MVGFILGLLTSIPGILLAIKSLPFQKPAFVQLLK